MTLGQRATKRIRALPFAYLGTGVRARVEHVALDGYEIDDVADADAHRIDLDGRAWRRIVLRVTIDVPRATIERVVPTAERSSPPLAVVVVLRCRTTHLRRGVEAIASDAPSDSTEDGLQSYVARIAVDRQDVRDTVELLPFLVRRRDARAPEARYARAAGARIASGWGWKIVVDASPRGRSRHIDVRYTSFSDSDWEMLREAADTLYLLEADLNQPVRLRDLAFDRIAVSVWMQLFLHAARDVDEDGETMFEWGRGVLENWLPDLMPDTHDAELRVERLREARDDASELAALLQRLDTLLQRRDHAVRHLVRMLEEAAGGR